MSCPNCDLGSELESSRIQLFALGPVELRNRSSMSSLTSFSMRMTCCE